MDPQRQACLVFPPRDVSPLEEKGKEAYLSWTCAWGKGGGLMHKYDSADDEPQLK